MPKYLEKIPPVIQYIFFLSYNGLQGDICFLTIYSLELLKISLEMGVILSHLSAGPAVMSSPGQSKFTCADHTHCGSGVRNPDRSLWSKGTNFLFIFWVCLWKNNAWLSHACGLLQNQALSLVVAIIMLMVSIRDMGWNMNYYIFHVLRVLRLATF